MSQAALSTSPYLNSNLFSDRYLDERVDGLEEWDCDERAADVFEELRSLWQAEEGLVGSYNEGELLDSWIGAVLDVLGFETLSETTLPDGGGYNDRLLFGSEDKRREAASETNDGRHGETYDLSSALLEAKRWDAPFDHRFSEDRSYRDASHQMKYYLERTPEKLRWGVLTNGRTWRLYGTKEYETQTFYEVDLPELLESGSVEAFKYFFVFFRPEAFRGSAGTTFLDTVWNESETAAQRLGEDLQNNAFTALRVLGRGFVETNSLDIDPGDEERLDELKEQSLVLLYRLMSVLYAESRTPVDPTDPDRRAEYEESFSLDRLRLTILQEVGERGSESDFDSYSSFSTSMWSRLETRFSLVDSGEGSLGIPPYDGGLFSEDRHAFLTENEVADRYLAEVVYRLSTIETDDGFVPVDYADLDTRHLGTIYEGLLEHEFRIAPTRYAAVSEGGGRVWEDAAEVSVADAVETVDAGGLYVVTDDGERKATGAYYTPDYVVTYIVEETVDPLVDEIESDLEERGLERGTREYVVRFADEILKLKLLDPAMGSGHFLTKATGYLVERVMERARELEAATAFDERQIRRDISRECIYGVDRNGMAVELAKLSMWLETAATDRPLAFSDHHLKAGNSLVGSDITDVLADDEGEGDRLALTQTLARVRQRTLERVMDLMRDSPAVDTESCEDVTSTEDIYADIRSDPLYPRLFEMANVHTAERFGVDVPDDAYEEMARAIEEDDEWAAVSEHDWFEAAQTVAADEEFFHWELEFPEVFLSDEGEKSENAGFDAVVGNPPYVRQEQLQSLKGYLRGRYQTYRSAADLYVYFVERGTELLRPNGRYGGIVSNKFTRAEYGRPLREYLEHNNIEQLLDFGDLPVFPNASAYPLILLLEKASVDSQNVRVAKFTDLEFASLREEVDRVGYEASADSLGQSGWSLSRNDVTEILSKLESGSTRLDDFVDGELYYGIKTGLNGAFFVSAEKRDELIECNPACSEIIEPLAVGDDINRYRIDPSGKHLILIEDGWTREQSGISDEKDAWDWFVDRFPNVADHLEQFSEEAESRYDRGEFWWELRPCDYYSKFDEDKIVYPVIAKGPQFALDTNSYFLNDKCFMIPIANRSLLGILNSTLAEFWVSAELSGLSGGFREFRSVHVKEFPVSEPSPDSDVGELVAELNSYRRESDSLNLSLPDYLGNYSDGRALSESGFHRVSDTANAAFDDTAEDREKLGVTEVEFERETPNALTVLVGVRYKPENPDDYETDTYGYHYEDPEPAFRVTDLTETEADLIEAFVPHAVDEAGGYANFRTNATKTNSPLDRLRRLTLPNVDDVRDGLESYVETVERAEELAEKIERTDELIDEMVYELYGLTEEEIETVEESVQE